MLVFQSVTAGASISKGNAEAPKLAVLLRPCQRGPANGPHSTLPSSLQDADMAEAWMIQYRPRRHMIYVSMWYYSTYMYYMHIICGHNSCGAKSAKSDLFDWKKDEKRCWKCSICFRLHEDPFRSWTPTLPMAEDLDQEQQGRCTVFAPWDGWRMISSYYSNISIFRLELCARMLKPGLFSQKGSTDH